MDINELTRHWGLEVDRVELTLGSLLIAPDDGISGPLIMPPSVPGLEGLAGPIQQLAMHFMGHAGSSHHKQGVALQTSTFSSHLCIVTLIYKKAVNFFFSTEDRITFTDELSSAPHGHVARLNFAEELLASVKLLMSENLVRQIGASYHFDVNSEDGGHRRYYVDLSQGN